MNSSDQMIHVRFAPDGSVIQIGACPAGLTLQQWFNLLSNQGGFHYQSLSGGRGLFRLPPELLERLSTKPVEVA